MILGRPTGTKHYQILTIIAWFFFSIFEFAHSFMNWFTFSIELGFILSLHFHLHFSFSFFILWVDLFFLFFFFFTYFIGLNFSSDLYWFNFCNFQLPSEKAVYLRFFLGSQCRIQWPCCSQQPFLVKFVLECLQTPWSVLGSTSTTSSTISNVSMGFR